MRKFEQVGFTGEEALKAFGCQHGIRYFIERPNESPTFVIGDFLTKLGVPENTTLEVCNRVHDGIMNFLRNEDGYGMLYFSISSSCSFLNFMPSFSKSDCWSLRLNIDPRIVSLPLLFMTLHHGRSVFVGSLFKIIPTARAARGIPAYTAICP